MREIKFRAWCAPLIDGETTLPGKMDYELAHYKLLAVKTETRQPPAGFGFDHLQHGIYFINADLAAYGDRLMQYTGLKDKNGKEIFEGDIVRCGETVGMGRKLLKQVMGEVQYMSNIAGFGIEVQTGNNEVGDVTAYSWEIPHFTDFEIIGNIYSNPELLTPTNK